MIPGDSYWSARNARFAIAGLLLTLALLAVLVVWPNPAGEPAGFEQAAAPMASSTTAMPTNPMPTNPMPTNPMPTTTMPAKTGTSTTTPERPYLGWVDPASVGEPYGDTVDGLLTFRGNPTRTYYGRGPVPSEPKVVWSYPQPGDVFDVLGRWRGHHLVRVGVDGPARLSSNATAKPGFAFGAYDRNVHFLDFETGKAKLPSFPTGDIIKGSVTIDPDGYPLLYTGSRDNNYRIIAFDGAEPRELWALNAYDVTPTKWNNDWDGAGLVLRDHLLIGGENSQFHVVRLNRGYDQNGAVTVDPELVFNRPGLGRRTDSSGSGTMFRSRVRLPCRATSCTSQTAAG